MALLAKADIKDYLTITGTEKDTKIESLILAVLSFIDTYCNRNFASAAYIEYFHGPTPTLFLKGVPIASSPVLVLYDDWQREFGSTTIVDADDYYIDSDVGLVHVDYDVGQGKGTVKVSYTGGYSALPADLKQACVEMVARKLKEGDGALGIPSRSIPEGGNVVFVIDDILPQTKVVLGRYVL